MVKRVSYKIIKVPVKLKLPWNKIIPLFLIGSFIFFYFLANSVFHLGGSINLNGYAVLGNTSSNQSNPKIADIKFIIPITNAWQLNSNKSVVKNIFKYVNQTDNLTYTIPEGDYARAIFEENLTKNNTINIYTKNPNNEPATIEIYEKNSNNLVGQIKNVTTGVYNINPNISGKADTFDFKSVGNPITYDFIQDGKPGTYPVDAIYYNPSATGAVDVNGAITANCIFEQTGSGTAVSGNVNTYLQFNTSSSGWANMSSGTTITADGSNPDVGTLASTGAALNTSQPTHNLVFTQIGTYYIRCYEPSETADSNVVLTSTPIQYTVTAPPSNIHVTLNSPVDFYNSSSSSINFNGTATSYQYTLSNVSIYTNISGSWVATQTDSSPTNNTPTLFTISSIPEGTYKWNYQSCDSNRVCNFSSSNRTFTVDTVPPSVTINSPLNKSYTTATSVFNITGSDSGTGINSCTYSLDGNANVSLTNSAGNYWTGTNSSMTQGSHTVDYYCTDYAGNLGTQSVTFFIDSIPPPKFSLLLRHCRMQLLKVKLGFSQMFQSPK